MHPSDWRLINGEDIEAIPAALARARGNATARALARNDWLIRRKSDGRFLALRRGEVVTELRRNALTPELRTDLATLADADAAGESLRPLSGLLERLHALGLNEVEYGESTGLSLVAEPCVLSYAGRDRYQRPLWLTHVAARAWRHMRASALQAGVALEAISGYRSHDYQLGIFRRKLVRGQTVAEILAVNAAPGYSEHHSGDAMDIGTPGEPPAEESFEATAAFAWLGAHANDFGFVMSYPRANPHGIVYEPWHWRWRENHA
jgi:D-alanyl-D-alanine carboxypeptidase